LRTGNHGVWLDNFSLLASCLITIKKDGILYAPLMADLFACATFVYPADQSRKSTSADAGTSYFGQVQVRNSVDLLLVLNSRSQDDVLEPQLPRTRIQATAKDKAR
jgi:hypothetical protein